MPHAISHIALVVRDPARTARLFEQLLGGRLGTLEQKAKGPPETFVLVAGLWMVLVQGEPPAERRDDHIAFSVDAGELPSLAAKLTELGLEHQMSRAGTAARSLYFVDYDNHLFELHAGLMDLEVAS